MRPETRSEAQEKHARIKACIPPEGAMLRGIRRHGRARIAEARPLPDQIFRFDAAGESSGILNGTNGFTAIRVCTLRVI
jgi:hypothetical protein